MKYILLLLLAIYSIRLSAQQKQFFKEDNGKFIYYVVVDSQKLGKAALLERAKGFLAANKKTVKEESATDSSLIAKGKLIIDKTVLVVGHPSGEISYNFVFEAKEGKYRFWLTDFVFIPYQRDRYGNFVPSINIGTPLEKDVDKLTAGQWKDIQATSYLKAEKFGESLKKFVATNTIKPAVKSIETISTRKW